ncbi:hypothetical protein HanRHA438_Chr06g0277691 [Helianthus annuus]|nr:hypothetical protein HanIR_Chr06g0288791 [Helianthus annuus]KAJ0912736.1 hypothetical protein HanRHA438_Chr06g0277691 [Helianthus annuus]KAJ0916209.1 hypothetical protein HanPSC8_Chr06g0259031 [Helianthus annuus]
MRAIDTPSVFSPAICWTEAAVTVAPKVLFVSPGFANPAKKKSSADMLALQVNPFTFTPVLVQYLSRFKFSLNPESYYVLCLSNYYKMTNALSNNFYLLGGQHK